MIAMNQPRLLLNTRWLAAVATALLAVSVAAAQRSPAAPMAAQDSSTGAAGQKRDRPPIVVTPTEVSVEKDQVIVIRVTASDPDGDPIASLTADLSHLPAENHATFKTNPTHTVGTLRWRTTILDFRVAPYVVTFTAKNALSGSAATSIVIEDLF
jgi:hypothetical protein